MSTDLAKPEAGLSDEQVALVKSTVAKGATNDELALFINRCNVSGLDPFSHQIWFVKRSGQMTIQTGIDGYRLIADRTSRHAGTDILWCGPEGDWRDVWLMTNHPAAAKAIVRKALPNGTVAEFAAVALWSEYGQQADGFAWKKMPAGQLAKCAEALALRRAFPNETSGMYVREEMDQATPEPVAAVPPRVDRDTGEIRQIETTTRREPPSQKAKPGYVSAKDAKWALVEAYMSEGISEEIAKKSAETLWGTRGGTAITEAHLAQLVEQAKNPAKTDEMVDENTDDALGLPFDDTQEPV